MSTLQEIKEMKPSEFWLGEIVAIHEISEYAFVEYKERKFPPHEDGEETGTYCFSIFIQGQSIGRSCNTIESALAHAIAYKYDGCNSRAADYFIKMIGSELDRDYLLLCPPNNGVNADPEGRA